MNTNLAYQEQRWEEIIGGRPVMMAPPMIRHVQTAMNLSRIFGTYLKGKPCRYFSEAGLFLEEGREEYIPDGMVVCDQEKIQANGVHGAPELVVEILSVTTARYDRGRKKEVYEAAGVREYWIVDPVHRLIEQYLLERGKFVLHDTYALLPEPERERIREREGWTMPMEFRCSLFEDLLIRLEDVFDQVS